MVAPCLPQTTDVISSFLAFPSTTMIDIKGKVMVGGPRTKVFGFGQGCLWSHICFTFGHFNRLFPKHDIDEEDESAHKNVFHAHDITKDLKEMTPVLGMKFPNPADLKFSLSNYVVAKGYDLGEVISAVGRDGNNIIYHLAWAIVDASTEENFKAVMDEIKFLDNRGGDCDAFKNGVFESFNSAILSARRKPIISMLEDIKEDSRHKDHTKACIGMYMFLDINSLKSSKRRLPRRPTIKRKRDEAERELSGENRDQFQVKEINKYVESFMLLGTKKTRCPAKAGPLIPHIEVIKLVVIVFKHVVMVKVHVLKHVVMVKLQAIVKVWMVWLQINIFFIYEFAITAFFPSCLHFRKSSTCKFSLISHNHTYLFPVTEEDESCDIGFFYFEECVWLQINIFFIYEFAITAFFPSCLHFRKSSTCKFSLISHNHTYLFPVTEEDESCDIGFFYFEECVWLQINIFFIYEFAITAFFPSCLHFRKSSTCKFSLSHNHTYLFPVTEEDESCDIGFFYFEECGLISPIAKSCYECEHAWDRQQLPLVSHCYNSRRHNPNPTSKVRPPPSIYRS
ncbi:hypothetical protein LXL04_029566 [Taraxacum kok-saghyz]